MDNHTPSASQDVLEKLEKLQKGGKPEDLNVLVEELEQHLFFTNTDLETVEAQIAVREKISDLLGGNIKIMHNEAINGRLKKLHEKLEKSIAAKKAPASAPKMSDSDKKKLLLSMSMGYLQDTLGPVYEIMEKDPLAVDPKLHTPLKEIQSDCKAYIDGLVIEDQKMSPSEQEDKAEEIRMYFRVNKIDGRIKRYLDMEAKAQAEVQSKKDAESTKTKAEADAKVKEEAEANAKAEAEAEAQEKEKRKLESEAKVKAEAEKGEREKKEATKKALDALNHETVFKDVLIKPDEYREDSKNPVIRAIIDLTKNLDKAKLSELSATLRSSDKIPTPSQTKKIRDMRDMGITTPDELDKRISEIKGEINKGKREVTTLNRQIDLQKTNMAALAGAGKENADREANKLIVGQLKPIYEEVGKKENRIGELDEQLEIYKEVQPFIGGNKMSPRQLLLRIIEFKNPGQNKNLQALGEKADVLIAVEEKKMGPNRKWYKGWGQLDKYTQVIKPSLKATLAEFAKIEQLEGMKPEELEELEKLRKKPDGLTEWVEKLKEKSKKVIPVLMAYLQMAIIDGKLNGSSRGAARELLNGLRTIRNKIVLKSVNGNPELANAKTEIRMQAYLTEMNQWDEKSVQVNREIVNQLIRKSYLKKFSWGVGLGVAGYTVVPLIGFPALASAASYVGWSAGAKIAGVGGYLMGKKLIKEYKPEHETLWKQAGGRALGFALLGVVGLAAPELISGTKFLFNKRKDIKKRATDTGMAVATTAGVTWAITSGTAKALAWPFKKVFGKKSSELPRKNSNPVPRKKPRLVSKKEPDAEPKNESDDESAERAA